MASMRPTGLHVPAMPSVRGVREGSLGPLSSPGPGPHSSHAPLPSPGRAI